MASKTKTESEAETIETKKQKTIRTESSNAKRKKSLGVRVIHGRIYDSQNGKSCHQCRQKTMDFSVSCKNRSERQCTMHFCRACLMNRYGEKAEAMAALGDWKCPKCRGICNCSLCMKKRGCCPTGRLLHAAKATGFSSVCEMLQFKSNKEVEEDAGPSSKDDSVPEEGLASTTKSKRKNVFEENWCLKYTLKTNGDDEKNENPEAKRIRKNDDNEKETKAISKEKAASLEKSTASNKVPEKNNKRQHRTEDSGAEMTNKGGAKYEQVSVFHECQKKATEVQGKVSVVEIPLPEGIELTNVANIDLPAEDIGHALQFLEFCEAFAKVLDIKKGQPECLLRELACGRSSRWSQCSSTVQFHIKLLSVLQKFSGRAYSSLQTEGSNSWLQALSKCISESQYQSKELLLDCANLVDEGGYGDLSLSNKLRLLNFLCDEALSTTELRSWIDEQNLEFVEEEKTGKEKVLSEREKERNMKKKLHDEVIRTILMKNAGPLSASVYQGLYSEIKAEATQNLLESMEIKDPVMTKNERAVNQAETRMVTSIVRSLFPENASSMLDTCKAVIPASSFFRAAVYPHERESRKSSTRRIIEAAFAWKI